MAPPIPTDVFIGILTELLQDVRDARAADLARRSKAKAKRFVRHGTDSDPTAAQRAATRPTRTAEAPDCVSFFSNTLKGATP